MENREASKSQQHRLQFVPEIKEEELASIIKHLDSDETYTIPIGDITIRRLVRQIRILRNKNEKLELDAQPQIDSKMMAWKENEVLRGILKQLVSDCDAEVDDAKRRVIAKGGLGECKITDAVLKGAERVLVHVRYNADKMYSSSPSTTNYSEDKKRDGI